MMIVRERVDRDQGTSGRDLAILGSKFESMSTTISSNSASNVKYTYQPATGQPSAAARFFQWAAGEDKERHIGWVGITVTTMTAIVFPLTMAVILMNGAIFGLIIGAMASLALVVVTNLAALPTKYTIPFYFLGILIDIVVIGLSLFIK
jgi:hypothetical protein